MRFNNFHSKKWSMYVAQKTECFWVNVWINFTPHKFPFCSSHKIISSGINSNCRTVKQWNSLPACALSSFYIIRSLKQNAKNHLRRPAWQGRLTIVPSKAHHSCWIILFLTSFTSSSLCRSIIKKLQKTQTRNEYSAPHINVKLIA